MVEHDLAKVGVASSSLVYRSFFEILKRNKCLLIRCSHFISAQVAEW